MNAQLSSLTDLSCSININTQDLAYSSYPQTSVALGGLAAFVRGLDSVSVQAKICVRDLLWPPAGLPRPPGGPPWPPVASRGLPGPLVASRCLKSNQKGMNQGFFRNTQDRTNDVKRETDVCFLDHFRYKIDEDTIQSII